MASDAVKKTIALIACAALLGVAYYGNYLPLRKSQAFIAVLRNGGNFKTVQDYLNAYADVFALSSPVGQEELVRNFTSNIVNIIANYQDTSITKPLVDFVNASFAPIIEQRELSFSQDMYVLGNLNQAAFLRTHEPRYLSEAERYYRDGLRRAPQRPQFLYGLLDVYRLEGNTQGVLEMRDAILKLWDDPRVNTAVEQYLALQISGTASGTKKASP